MIASVVPAPLVLSSVSVEDAVEPPASSGATRDAALSAPAIPAPPATVRAPVVVEVEAVVLVIVCGPVNVLLVSEAAPRVAGVTVSQLGFPLAPPVCSSCPDVPGARHFHKFDGVSK